ncbi:outer membrane transport energization protein ExbD [Paracoccus seriniphilus]|uniref:Outer membrane transport energization protein ExbD n=2 Tax=Paracoccus seriniphilus TaxID=184748 RepID=A0A239PMJ3_9RHOB|nr:outer membrane transport energization protein ExbD [Paracoccus seriniphilus]
MQIDMPPRKPKAESIIPMINVVFLLLIFFLLTAQITPREPFEITPPESKSELAAQDRGVLYISAEGELAYDEARGEDVWPLIAARDDGEDLEIRADSAMPAHHLAAVLRQLRQTSDIGAQLVVNGG